MIETTPIEDPIESGAYIVETCRHPSANDSGRNYDILYFALPNTKLHVPGWNETFAGSAKPYRPFRGEALAWAGPISGTDLESIDDPPELGYYAVLLRPWPDASPKFRMLNVCVWRDGTWYDSYGYARQYGDILGWWGPVPMLSPAPPWLAEACGL